MNYSLTTFDLWLKITLSDENKAGLLICYVSLPDAAIRYLTKLLDDCVLKRNEILQTEPESGPTYCIFWICWWGARTLSTSCLWWGTKSEICWTNKKGALGHMISIDQWEASNYLGGLGETQELLRKGDTGISLINHRLTWRSLDIWKMCHQAFSFPGFCFFKINLPLCLKTLSLKRMKSSFCQILLKDS